MLNEEDGWRPAITIKQLVLGINAVFSNGIYELINIMFLGIQDLLDNPNPKSPAQREAIEIYLSNKAEYKRKVREQALKNAPEL